MITRFWIKCVATLFFIFFTSAVPAQQIRSAELLKPVVAQFKKAEFDIVVSAPFDNPYDLRDIAVDMVLSAPSGKAVLLPVYFVSGTVQKSSWTARFTPQEVGTYHYHFQLWLRGKLTDKTAERSFSSAASQADGFLHVNDNWTLLFDSGKPFRGIGENIGWEGRSFEDPQWTYDYLLPKLADNGGNFFRTWMCAWNLPLAWKTVDQTKRYKNSNSYFNESAIQRMDELVRLCDSLGLYFMLSLDAHGALIPSAEWQFNNHNRKNGGPVETPAEFFSHPESKAMYKNRLRYLIARWGYSPSIAAWEFFNEVDNTVFTSRDSLLIAHDLISGWHAEMSHFIKANDPYKHIITTSVSHREIEGMNGLPGLDINQKHIYRKTNEIPSAIRVNSRRHQKPYIIGEFSYDWDWNNVTQDRGEQFDFDFKRGLWYGLFSPTPVLPMTWWWEYFDKRGMISYLKAVRMLNDEMLEAGKGSFEEVPIQATGAKGYAVKCGQRYFVYMVRNDDPEIPPSFTLSPMQGERFTMRRFDPDRRDFSAATSVTTVGGSLKWDCVTSPGQTEWILVFTPDEVR